MDPVSPVSGQKALQPLDYASPTNQPPRRRSWILFVILPLIAVLLISVLLPSTNYSHIAPRVKSASNLRQIGQAILLYCNDNQGEYPDSLQTLLLNEDITSIVFVSPLRSETAAVGPTTQAIAAQLGSGNHVSYVYLGRGLSQSTATPNMVVAYEMLAQPGSGTNVLFGDGHVEFVGPVTAAKIIGSSATGMFPVTLPSQPNSYP